MISKILKLLLSLAIVSTIAIIAVFSIWDIPVKQQNVEIEIDSSQFINKE